MAGLLKCPHSHSPIRGLDPTHLPPKHDQNVLLRNRMRENKSYTTLYELLVERFVPRAFFGGVGLGSRRASNNLETRASIACK